MKKFGGIDNKKTLDEVQEAVIVGAPIIQKKMLRSKFGIMFGWIIYYVITFIITILLLLAIGMSEQMFYMNLPLWVREWLIPSIPFVLTLLLSLFFSKREARKESAGN